MQTVSEKRFLKTTCLWVLLLGTLPQVLRLVLDFIYAYEIEGNVAYDTLGQVIGFASDFLGPLSFFAGFGAVIYLTFLYGMRQGGEWIIALYGGYGLVYLLLSYVIVDYTFGVAAFALVAMTVVFVLFGWLRGGLLPVAIAVATLCLPLLGGMATLFATSAVSDETLFLHFLYGLASLGLELLLFVTAGRMANAFRLRAIDKGGDSADIAVGRKLFPWQNPVLAVCALMAGIYVVIHTIEPIRYASESVKEYGWPVNAEEWLSLFYPYLELLIVFVVGYAVMLLMVGRIEAAFLRTEEKKGARGR